MNTLQNLDITKTPGATISKVDPMSIPGFIPNSAKDGWDPLKWRIRYKKLNMDDAGDVMELELIETKAIRNQGVYVLSKERFLFMDKIMMLVQYMEKIDQNG